MRLVCQVNAARLATRHEGKFGGLFLCRVSVIGGRKFRDNDLCTFGQDGAIVEYYYAVFDVSCNLHVAIIAALAIEVKKPTS